MRGMIRTGAILSAAGFVLCILLTAHLKAAGPSVSTASAGDDGLTVFQHKCAVCHGKDGKGLPNWKAKGQPDFTDQKWQKATTDSHILFVIHNGKGRFMPGFRGKLSEADISALAAQVRAFGKK